MGIFLYLLLGIGIITQRSSTDIPGPKTIELTEGGERAITNSGFPFCCHGNETFHVKCSPIDRCYVNFEFTDLDLPPGSQLRINHGTSGVPLFRSGEGKKLSGSLRKEIIIVLEAPTSDVDVGRYVGFRMLLRTSPHVSLFYNTRDENCGSSPLEQPMWAGASVTTTANVGRLDCIWQMKIPPKNKGLKAYLNITVNSIRGVVVVTEYITSQGHQVVHHEGQTGASKPHDENLGYFTSEHGFYVRAKVQSGATIGFRTGFYTDPAANDTRKYVCTMKYGTVTAEGVRCKNPESCVSNETLCNDVITCGNKQDELPPFCEEATTVATLAPTNTEPTCVGPWLKTCLNGRCINSWDMCPEQCVNKTGYVLCTDGRCIRKHYDCDCPERQRRCPDGRCRLANIECPRDSRPCPSRPCPDSTCADDLNHCPGEPCPDSTFKCGTAPQCYVSRKDCDGVADCDNAYDERPGCSAHRRHPRSAGGSWKWWIILLVILILLLFMVPIFFIYRRVKNQERETSSAEPSIRPTRREAEVRLFPVSDQSSEVSNPSPRPPNRPRRPQPSAPHVSAAEILPPPPPPAYEDIQPSPHTYHLTNHQTRDEELPPYESVANIHASEPLEESRI